MTTYTDAAQAQQLDALFPGVSADLERLRSELAELRAVRDKMLDDARADLGLCAGYLDAVTNGLSVRELAQLADVAAEVRQRWGLEQ